MAKGRFAVIGVKLWLTVPVANIGTDYEQIGGAINAVRPFVDVGADIGPATVDEYEFEDYSEVFEDE